MLIEGIRIISNFFIFFLREDFERTKKCKTQINDFPPLRCLYAHKNPAFLIFCLLVCFLFAFCLPVCFLFAQNLLVKKTKKFEITLIASIHITTKSRGFF